MLEDANNLTPYPGVNAILSLLLQRVQSTLQKYFVGMYIHGSLASGRFNPDSSDIDFVVVTIDELPAKLLQALKTMHARITSSGLKWATRLEGPYIPQHALRRYDRAHSRHPALSVDGSFGVDGHGSDWIIQRHIIREHGIVMAGPSPKTLIDLVEPDDLRRAVRGIFQEWWSSPLPAPARFESSEYQAYAVLTMCRALYTLQHGTVTSKPAAARWAQQILGERWAPLIERALAWRHDDQLDDKSETLEFVQYTVERSQQFELHRRQ